MLSSELRGQVDKVWGTFWSGGMANPLEIIEQLTYLLFLKRLDDLQTLAENKIYQMKIAAIKEMKDSSIKLAMESVKKIISTSIDKSKLDNIFQKNLEESKIAIKKIKF